MTTGRRRALLRTALVLAGLVALASQLGTTTLLDALRGLDTGTLLGAVAIGAVTTTAAAGRWWLVARGLGAPLPLRTAVTDVYRATLLNSVLPAGVVGDVQRAVAHGRTGGRAVVVERVAGQTVVIVTCAALWGATSSPSPALVGRVLAGLGVIALLGLVAALVGRGRRPSRVRTAVIRLGRDVRVGVLSARTGPGVLVLSLVALAGYLALFALAARAAGATLPVPDLVRMLIPALLAMSLPLGVAGFGPREAAAAATFAAAGAGAATGLAAAMVYGVLATVSCVPGAVVLLWDLRPVDHLASLWRQPCSSSSATASPRPTPAGCSADGRTLR